MGKYWALLLITAASLITVVIFQNCASDFDAETYANQIQQASSGQPPAPPPPTSVQPPVINAGPQSVTVNAGSDATFSVSASGSSLQYQWSKGGIIINGASSNTYTISSAQTSHAGTYSVSVFNSAGAASSSATLTVNPAPVASAPVITSQPQNQFAFVGDSAQFSVVAAGPSLTYQWYKLISGNFTALAGQNSNTLNFPSALVGHSGTYRVTVINPYGQVSSNAVTLQVEVNINNFGPDNR